MGVINAPCRIEPTTLGLQNQCSTNWAKEVSSSGLESNQQSIGHEPTALPIKLPENKFGQGGIRTHGTKYYGFQNHRIKPLCHLLNLLRIGVEPTTYCV